MFSGKKILITGGTGSLGKALTKKLLTHDVDTIRIFSRDELRQDLMETELRDDRLRFLIGDIRDKPRLSRAMEDIDIVIHTAALKRITTAEYNPFEAIKTNVYGSQNVIESSLENNVNIVLAIGTDKAVSPYNTYGATKFLMERLFISANHYKGIRNIKFLAVRYGNVLGSRGSIVPILVDQIKSGKNITITDPSMTRFNITMSQALDLIFRAIKNGNGGEVFIPKLKAYTVENIKDAILELMNSNAKTERIKVRPGEKYHESLISKDELRNTYETIDDYVIFDEHMQVHNANSSYLQKPTHLIDAYSSNSVTLLNKEEIKDVLLSEKLIPVDN